MRSIQLHAGRRATQLVPALGSRAVAVTVAKPNFFLNDDVKMFAMTFAGGLVFFGTFLG